MANTILGLFKTHSDEDPLADSGAITSWMEKQPVNDHLVRQEAMVRLLEDMAARQPKVTPERVLAALELDRLSLPTQARLLKQFLQSTLSEPVRQRLWHACDDLARWFAYTYENQSDASHESFLSKKVKWQLPGVSARMFYYRGLQAKHSLFRYEHWIPSRWTALHAAYETAVRRGAAHVAFGFNPDGPASERYTTEHEYLHILLMQRLNTGNLSAAQIQMAATWMRVWVRQLVLSPPPLEGAGFWLDLGLGDGLLGRKPQNVARALLYLDIAPLQKRISNGLLELTLQMQRASATAARAEAGERRALLQRLEQLWRPGSKPTERRGARVKAERPVYVATGLTEIFKVLEQGDSSQERAQRKIRQREAIDVASGRAPPTFGITEQGSIDFKRQSGNGWQMEDTSESGCKLVTQSDAAAYQKLGDLLGIKGESESRWMIGIVRRLGKSEAGQTELGVEIVAQHSVLIKPRPLVAQDSGYSVDGRDVSAAGKSFSALYLPPTQSGDRAPQRSMVVAVQEYSERRHLFLTFENTASTIEFTTALERTKSWVWSAFNIVKPAR